MHDLAEELTRLLLHDVLSQVFRRQVQLVLLFVAISLVLLWPMTTP
jgi:hypothetical protein